MSPLQRNIQDCIQSLKKYKSYTKRSLSMASSSSSSNRERELNQELWEACAGVDIDIPKLDSLVYYFPRDHIEHSSSTPSKYVLLPYYDSRLCHVTNVSFHADAETDQVFVKFLLEPWIIDHEPSKNPDPNPNPNPIGRNRIHNNANVTFVKVLSKSDIREGLLVTKTLRDYIFSQLRPQNPGREIIQLIDIHGKIWELMLQLKDGMFNRLTSGWYDFAKIKNLKEGDSIVFLLNKSTNECHVGIRRAVINRRPISIKDVHDAIKNARNMKSTFEVVYYPILGLPEFVVPKVKVDNARRIGWRRELPVTFAFELGGLQPLKWWHNGRLLNIDHRENDMGNWPDSWWRVLQVKWHVSPEILEKKPNLQKNMSPWELEV